MNLVCRQADRKADGGAGIISAFLVDDTPITKILTVMAQPSPLTGDGDRQHGQPSAWFDELRRDMLPLNHRALFASYNDTVPDHIEYMFPGLWSAIIPVQSYKALQCWLYHCTEGDRDEDHPLYLRAVQWEAELDNRIFKRLLEYEAAEWG